MELGREQQEIYNLLENTKGDYFITGKAGTGKSVLLEHFVINTKKKVIVLAPTGIAAVNIGGQTIHSFFQLPIGLLNEKRVVSSVSYELESIIRRADAFVIDEISMVRADLMDAIDKILRKATDMDTVPFGGKQMIFFGDLYQLPPVATGDDKSYLKNKFGSIYFFSADGVRECELTVHELGEVFRQKDDNFKEILNCIRTGENLDRALNQLNEKCYRIDDAERLQIATTNKIVDKINKERLDKIDSETRAFTAIIKGDERKVVKVAADILELKVGARVMFLRNDSEGRWYNGTIGEIVNFNSNGTIRIDVGTKRYDVERITWEVNKYVFNEERDEIKTEEVASYSQFPLRLAWAITAHKSQGQTYSQVEVNMGFGSFDYGQTYVALSRCESMEGLILSRPLRIDDVKTNPLIRRYMKAKARA